MTEFALLDSLSNPRLLEICDSNYISAKPEIRCSQRYIALHFSSDMTTRGNISKIMFLHCRCGLVLNILFNFLRKLNVIVATVYVSQTFYCNHATLASFQEAFSFGVSQLVFHLYLRTLQCCTRCTTEQFYYIRKVLHMKLVVRSKCQNVLVYKSCTLIKVFWGHNIVLCKELCEKIALY